MDAVGKGGSEANYWKDLLFMSAGVIRFMISSTFDMLPSPEFEEMGD